jgi:hypothetical protein
MLRKKIWGVSLIWTIAVGALIWVGCSSQKSPVQPDSAQTMQKTGVTRTGLSFPFQNPDDIDYFKCFGLSGWDGENTTHGGIDCVPYFEEENPLLDTHSIIAPVDSTVAAIYHVTTGAGKACHVVVLQINDYWFVTLNFEPQSNDKVVNNSLQEQHIYAQVGTSVKRGDLIGELVVKDADPDHYPHIHFGLLYKDPHDTLDDIAVNQNTLARSDGVYIPAMTGPLRLPSTYFCPYEYSTETARTVFERKDKKNVDGELCNSVCAYGSKGGDCGTAGCVVE